MQIAINSELTSIKNTNIPGLILFNKLSDIPKSNTFFCSTLSDCEYLNANMYGIVKFFNLSVINWLAFVKDNYMNYDSYFKLACQLNNNDLGHFCRINSNNKNIHGKILYDIYDISSIQNSIQEDTILLLSTNKTINNEVRFFIINDEIIDYVEIPNKNNKLTNNVIEKYKEFVNKMNNYYQPDDMFSIDIGTNYLNEIKIIDYNCFSLSNFYNMNLTKITAEIKKHFLA